MSDPLHIREILEQVHRGQLRIPAFQRGFVWDADMVAHFMDTIYKRYPFGSLLLWRTKEGLRHERKLGPYTLPERKPDYPVDYVLDGQQRITSIFGVFQTELNEEIVEPWTQIYFDFRSDPNAQDSQFSALAPHEVDPSRHFPLKSLFDTVLYRKSTVQLSEELQVAADELQARFKEAIVPVQLMSTEDRATVAIVFERVNRKGVPLETLDLLAAWTWSEEFDLHRKFEEIASELEPFGFADIGEDTTLLLRCCAALIAHDASPGTLINLNGAMVRDRFEELVNGVNGAIDFLRANLNVHSLNNLPYLTILVPLSVFFAVPGNKHALYTEEQRRTIIRWFWRTCFAQRYYGAVLRNLKTDINEMLKLKRGEDSQLGSFNTTITPEFFTRNSFRINTVNTKTMILLLAQRKPRSFISGVPIGLERVLRECNRNEFHHIFPRAYLTAYDEDVEHSRLVNFCFMSKQDNTKLGGVAPSQYRAKMPTDVGPILESALCPDSVFSDDYARFTEERAELLAKEAQSLIEQ